VDAINMESFVSIHQGGGYESEVGAKPRVVESTKRPKYTGHVPGGKYDETAGYHNFEDKHLKQIYGREWGSLDAYSRHKKLVNDYMMYYGGQNKWKPLQHSYGVTDADILRDNHRFIRSEAENDESTWEKRMAKKYYDRLFKEYALVEFGKKGKLGMRWRVEKEVIGGKGQFVCANTKCNENEKLMSYEVSFGYSEKDDSGTPIRKQTLVKVRLCPECGYKLNYKKIKELKKEERMQKKLQRINKKELKRRKGRLKKRSIDIKNRRRMEAGHLL